MWSTGRSLKSTRLGFMVLALRRAALLVKIFVARFKADSYSPGSKIPLSVKKTHTLTFSSGFYWDNSCLNFSDITGVSLGRTNLTWSKDWLFAPDIIPQTITRKQRVIRTFLILNMWHISFLPPYRRLFWNIIILDIGKTAKKQRLSLASKRVFWKKSHLKNDSFLFK